jgi:uncharacterized protein (TIGR02118 family)
MLTSGKGEHSVATILTVYNAKDTATADEYEKYLRAKKVALVRAIPAVQSYEIYRVDAVLGPAVSNPVNPPTEPPYRFVAKIEVSSVEDFVAQTSTPEGTAFVEEYSAFLEPTVVLTLAHGIEPGG